jgi:phosphoenolpyruvate synthase/pyruvate phosphate dikinase
VSFRHSVGNSIRAVSKAGRSTSAQDLVHDNTNATLRGLEIGICGQAPSDHPDEVPPFLVEHGITSISVTPDTVVRARLAVMKAEAQLGVAPGQGEKVGRLTA